jgi:hypothetical protein
MFKANGKTQSEVISSMNVIGKKLLKNPIGEDIGMLELVELKPNGDYSLLVRLHEKTLKCSRNREKTIEYFNNYSHPIDRIQFCLNRKTHVWERK